ncbi:hypothetical protein SELMODRAFT_422594 [Selaginella moellendorffii]|uniref:Uncharacterized protein n=1 Tax=Selaginella moellendorffii TaxID=88036 RepID=D8SIY0_SELML|nr:hypothetical protein SELMODRAFT_422594 [Selaginella moellendorffii]
MQLSVEEDLAEKEPPVPRMWRASVAAGLLLDACSCELEVKTKERLKCPREKILKRWGWWLGVFLLLCGPGIHMAVAWKDRIFSEASKRPKRNVDTLPQTPRFYGGKRLDATTPDP